MANTSYVRRIVEPWIRSQLVVRFGQPFSSRVLTLSPGGRHEFDAVSDDLQIVASIKSGGGLTSGGRHPSGKVATCLAEVYFLSLISAPARLLLLTNPALHDIFLRVTSGKIAKGVTIELLELPVEMQRILDGVTEIASKEMGAG